MSGAAAQDQGLVQQVADRRRSLQHSAALAMELMGIDAPARAPAHAPAHRAAPVSLAGPSPQTVSAALLDMEGVMERIHADPRYKEFSAGFEVTRVTRRDPARPAGRYVCGVRAVYARQGDAFLSLSVTLDADQAIVLPTARRGAADASVPVGKDRVTRVPADQLHNCLRNLVLGQASQFTREGAVRFLTPAGDAEFLYTGGPAPAP